MGKAKQTGGKRPGFNWRLFVVAAVIGLAAGLLLGLASLWLQAPRSAGSQPPTNTASFKVRSSKVIDGQRGYFKAGEGRKFVILEVELHNSTSTVLQVAPVTQTYLKAGDGTRYGLSFYTHKQPLKGGQLKPGQSQTGQLAYSVPAGVTTLDFYFLDASVPVNL